MRLFSNLVEHPVPYGSKKENGCGTFGDLTDKVLFELNKLGITHLWLTGIIDHATCTNYSAYGMDADDPYIVKGRAGSPYAIRDFFNLAPDLSKEPGDRWKEFDKLIKRCHDNGLKVIVDFVPNHVARNYVGLNSPSGDLILGKKV